MRLIPNWRKVLRHAWSVRLIVLAGVLTGCEAILPVVPNLVQVQPGVFAALTFAVVMLALVSRFIAQQKISG